MANQKRIPFFVFILIIILVSVLGGYFVFWATNWSPWAFSDSAAYLSAARNFDAGSGLVTVNSNGTTTRVTEFAPLYPIALSILTGRNGSFIQTARWLDVVAFSMSIFLAGFFTYIATRNSIAGGVVSLFMALSPIMLDAFSGMMSEPLFILLLIFHLFLLWEYISDPNVLKFTSIIFFTLLLPLTRYAGIVFPISAGVLVVFLGKQNFLKNLLKGITLGAISLLPIGFWFLDLYLQLNKVGGKRFALDFSIIGSFLRSLYNEYLVIRNWLPYYGIYSANFINLLIEVFFITLFTLVSVIGVYRVVKNTKSLEKQHLFFIITAMTATSYLAFIALTHSITIPQIDIINRMLAPVLPVLFMIAASVFSFEFGNEGKRAFIWQLPLAILIVLTVRYNLLITTHKVTEYYQDGFGFNSREVQESGLLAELERLDKEKPMISNSAAFVLFHTDRFPINIANFHNRPYGSGDAYGEKTFREKNAPLIIHLPDFYNTYSTDAEQMLSNITSGLNTAYSGMVGAIFYYPK